MSRCLPPWNFHSCGAGSKQISSHNCQRVGNPVKKKKAGIEIECMGVSMGTSVAILGRGAGNLDEVTLEKTLEEVRGKSIPGRGSSVEELERQGGHLGRSG